MANFIYGTRFNDVLSATADAVTYVYGYAGTDELRNDSADGTAIMIGGKGNDSMYGGARFDSFVFTQEKTRFVDHVFGFETAGDGIERGGDRLDFSKCDDFDSWRDVMHETKAVDGDVYIHVGGGTVILHDTDIRELDRADFYMG